MEDRSADQYQYKPLESKRHIRLFYVTAATVSEPMKARIEHTSVDENESFMAFSYVWGDPTHTGKLEVEGSGSIPLTQSLVDLLRDTKCLQGEDNGLWIDQICINQQNPAEKAEQILLMGDIYRNASFVFTYLGPSNEADVAGMKLLYDIAIQKNQAVPNPLPSDINGSSSVGPVLTFDEAGVLSIFSVLDRPWLDRIWLVQENVLNKYSMIVCGSIILPWRALLYFVEVLFESGKFVYHIQLPQSPSVSSASTKIHRLEALVQLARIRDVYHEAAIADADYYKPFSLEQLLVRLQHLASRDPRDKIYALLGLAVDDDEINITPNYSISDADVFTHVARQIIFKSQNLSILNYVVPRCDSIRDCPSWVPTWGSHEHSDTWLRFHRLDRASGEAAAKVEFCDIDSAMITHGLFIDEIFGDAGVWKTLEDRLGEWTTASYERFTSVHEKIREWTRSDAGESTDEEGDDYQAEELFYCRLAHALIETDVTGNDIEEDPLNPTQDEVDLARSLAIFVNYGRRTYGPKLTARKTEFTYFDILPILRGVDKLEMRKFYADSLRTVGKHICVTQRRHLCTSKVETRPGDRIAILFRWESMLHFATN